MNRGPSIMLIDDSFEDAELISTILEMSSTDVGAFIHYETGDAASEYLQTLKANGRPRPASVPSLILLDLNMPGTDGRDILRWIKSTEGLRKIPVVITSTSSNPADVTYCYETGANGYFRKPILFDEYTKAMNVMMEYWFGVLNLPED